ncbi:MAG TPA: beta-galactosidase [Bryobacteraceae bacterium]|jgi:beta-galactosidase
MNRRDALTILTMLPFQEVPSIAAPPRKQGIAREPEPFFPMSVWYGGGKARAPMLEANPLTKTSAWRGDLVQIRKLGFNTVRCWIDWASGEPDEGKYDFQTLDIIFKLASEQGLKVIIQVYMDSAPLWVGRKFPDSLFVSSNGMAIHPESAPGYCRDHPGVRDAELKFYRAVGSLAKQHSSFVGWDLWSEPHVINWANPTYIEHPEFCFCKYTIARFRRWVQQKYGTLDALNQSWYRRYTSWDEVQPNRLSTILSFTDFIDWKHFIADKLGEDLADRYHAVKSVTPDAVATSHAAGIGLFSSPLWWEGQSDDWTMKDQVDYYGTSFYPKHSFFANRDIEWRGALLDFTRSFGYGDGGNGFWIGELQSGTGTVALGVGQTVTPDDLRIWTWSALARGAKAINYYAWYPMSSGYESDGFGMIELNGDLTERSRTAGAIARLVDRNQQIFLKASPPQARVAIVYNPLSYFIGGRQQQAAYGGPQGEVNGIERDSMLGIYRALFATNVPVEFIHISHLSHDLLSKFQLVFLPYPLMIPSSCAAPLKQYVTSGGALVAEARLGWNNEHGTASETIPGMGLFQVMGCKERSVQLGAKGRTTLRWTSDDLRGMKRGDELPARWFEETLEPIGPNAHVMAEFPSGGAAAIFSQYGKGKTLMLGSYVAAAFETQREPATARFYASLLDWAGVERPIVTRRGNPEVRYLESGDARLAFIFNHGDKPQDVDISIPVSGSNYRATDLVSSSDVAIDYQSGRVSLRKQLRANETWVVKLEPSGR